MTSANHYMYQRWHAVSWESSVADKPHNIYSLLKARCSGMIIYLSSNPPSIYWTPFVLQYFCGGLLLRNIYLARYIYYLFSYKRTQWEYTNTSIIHEVIFLGKYWTKLTSIYRLILDINIININISIFILPLSLLLMIIFMLFSTYIFHYFNHMIMSHIYCDGK